MHCLGQIGCPRSLEYVMDEAVALGGIRHPKVEPILEQKVRDLVISYSDKRIEELLTTCKNSRLRGWIPFYERMKKEGNARNKRPAAKAILNSHPPFEEEPPV